jgi:hypothetical protein
VGDDLLLLREEPLTGDVPKALLALDTGREDHPKHDAD